MSGERESLELGSSVRTHNYRSVGECEHPVWVISSESGEEVAVRCGSRLANRCESCSRLAVRDYQRLIGDGFTDVDSGEFRFFFLTLTAPSFGPTHSVPKPGRDLQRCRCGAFHDPVEDADLRGVCIDPNSYDFEGCCRWNYGLGDLWDSTRSRLCQRFPGLSYAKVSEYQARGALHVHVLVRIPLGVPLIYGELTGAEALLEVARSSATRSGLRWGEQGDCKRIVQAEDRDRFVYYMAKVLAYVTKDVMDDCVVVSAQAKVHYRLLDLAASRMRCDRCRDWNEPCGGLSHRRWGARSSVLSKSRESKSHLPWSRVRRLDLKARRREFARMAEALRVGVAELARSAAGVKPLELMELNVIRV
ncbi:replication initiator [Actinomyces sp.]|uniref:replication initiator n=1 Tax=Actinomyces sp. TaxID=29317 RepID=UPI0029140A70|nr:replication initiator [Actinomyces sp.]MDU5231148.1 replication initiator [Actinomyces sp.]MDU6756650.1 replication initiator [Actinomyces sp.]